MSKGLKYIIIMEQQLLDKINILEEENEKLIR